MIKDIQINNEYIDNIMNTVYLIDNKDTNEADNDEDSDDEDDEKKLQQKISNKKLNNDDDIMQFRNTPDVFDIEIMLAAYQKKFDTTNTIKKIIPYMKQ